MDTSVKTKWNIDTAHSEAGFKVKHNYSHYRAFLLLCLFTGYIFFNVNRTTRNITHT